jgi:hypothetical protein
MSTYGGISALIRVEMAVSSPTCGGIKYRQNRGFRAEKRFFSILEAKPGDRESPKNTGNCSWEALTTKKA